MGAEHTVYFRHAAVNGAGITVDLTAIGLFGSLYIINKGTDEIYFRLDNVLPAAALGNNQKQLQQYECANLENIQFTYVSLIAGGGGGPSDVEIIVAQRVGAGGII